MSNKKSATQPVKVLFMGGYGRSGSTIIELLMSQVPGVVIMGEIRHLFGRVMIDDELCNCGTPLLNCLYWKEVFDIALPNGYDQPKLERAMRQINSLKTLPQLRYEFLRGKKFQSQLDLYTETFASVYAEIARKSKAKFVVDSSKHPLHAIALATRPDLFDLRAMLLVRDPRAVANSWEMPKLRPEIYWEDRLMPEYSAYRSAFAWNVSNSLTEMLRKFDLSVTVIRYEDFANKPLDTLAEIYSLGIDQKIDLTEDIFLTKKIKKYHKVAGNPLGLKGDKIIVENKEKWNTQLSKSKQLFVKLVCYQQMKKFDYL